TTHSCHHGGHRGLDEAHRATPGGEMTTATRRRPRLSLDPPNRRAIERARGLITCSWPPILWAPPPLPCCRPSCPQPTRYRSAAVPLSTRKCTHPCSPSPDLSADSRAPS